MENQISIHPGVVGGRRQHPLEKSTKPHQGKGKLAKKMKRLHTRRLAHAETLKRMPSNSNPAAFKTPGSMNAKK
jgi:hypothetical protein